MGMSSDQYIRLMTAPHQVNLGNFSEIDPKGIQQGKAYIGY